MRTMRSGSLSWSRAAKRTTAKSPFPRPRARAVGDRTEGLANVIAPLVFPGGISSMPVQLSGVTHFFALVSARNGPTPVVGKFESPRPSEASVAHDNAKKANTNQG